SAFLVSDAASCASARDVQLVVFIRFGGPEEGTCRKSWKSYDKNITKERASLRRAAARTGVGDLVTTPKEKFETRKLPMIPIRDVVIFPFMMTPFVVGRDSTV